MDRSEITRIAEQLTLEYIRKTSKITETTAPTAYAQLYIKTFNLIAGEIERMTSPPSDKPIR